MRAFNKRPLGAALGMGMLIAAASAFPASTMADIPYFLFEYGALHFNYTRNGNAATPGAMIGTLSLSRTGSSIFSARKYSAGPNGLIQNGGGDDVPLDTDTTFATGDFGFSVSSEVFFNGTNSYEIRSSGSGGNMVAGTDSTSGGGATSGDSFQARMHSTSVIVSGVLFSFTGLMSNLLTNDAVLLDNDTPNGPGWTFWGSNGQNIGLTANRDSYDIGQLIEIFVDFSASFSDLDDFFYRQGPQGSMRDNQTGETKLTVVPAPAAVMLGAIGLIIVGHLKRRLG